MYLRTVGKGMVAILIGLSCGCSHYKTSADKHIEVGDPVSFSLPSHRGTPISSDTYRGSYLLVHFWATWCIPCVYDLLSLQNFAAALADDGLMVLTVAVESDWDAVDSLFTSRGITLPAALDRQGTLKNTFGLRGVPETFLVSPDGVIAGLPDPLDGQTRTSVVGLREWSSQATIALYRRRLRD